MASKSFFVDLNLNSNQLLNTVFEKLATAPASGVEGRVIYQQSLKQVLYYDGTQWKPMGEVQSVSGTAPIVVTSASGIYTVSINPATTTNAGSLSASDKKKIDDLVQVDDDTDVPHASGGSEEIIGSSVYVYQAISSLDAWDYAHTGSSNPNSNTPHNELKQNQLDTNINLGNSDTKMPSQKAVKTYVDGLVSSSGRPVVPFDPNLATDPLATSNLPLSYDTPYANGGADAILKGDQFVISIAGNIGVGLAIPVNPNDTIIAGKDMTVDHADTQLDANWSIIRAATVQSASESVEGIAFLATQAEALAGTDTVKIITPATMHAFGAMSRYTKAATQAGSGASITVNHAFNNRNVAATAYETSTGNEIIGEASYQTSSCTMTLNTAPGFSWTLVVIGEDLTP